MSDRLRVVIAHLLTCSFYKRNGRTPEGRKWGVCCAQRPHVRVQKASPTLEALGAPVMKVLTCRRSTHVSLKGFSSFSGFKNAHHLLQGKEKAGEVLVMADILRTHSWFSHA